jgi:hypothetical protein
VGSIKSEAAASRSNFDEFRCRSNVVAHNLSVSIRRNLRAGFSRNGF